MSFIANLKKFVNFLTELSQPLEDQSAPPPYMYLPPETNRPVKIYLSIDDHKKEVEIPLRAALLEKGWLAKNEEEATYSIHGMVMYDHEQFPKGWEATLRVEGDFFAQHSVEILSDVTASCATDRAWMIQMMVIDPTVQDIEKQMKLRG